MHPRRAGLRPQALQLHTRQSQLNCTTMVVHSFHPGNSVLVLPALVYSDYYCCRRLGPASIHVINPPVRSGLQLRSEQRLIPHWTLLVGDGEAFTASGSPVISPPGGLSASRPLGEQPFILH